MAKSKKVGTSEDKLLAKLDSILEVMQNIFILEAVKAGMPVAVIRDILRIDKKRIGAISKHLSSE